MPHIPSAVPAREEDPGHIDLGPPGSPWLPACTHQHAPTHPTSEIFTALMVQLVEWVAVGWLVTVMPPTATLMLVPWPTKLIGNGYYTPTSLLAALVRRGCPIYCFCALYPGILPAAATATFHTDLRTGNHYFGCHTFCQTRGSPRCPFRINLSALFAHIETHGPPNRALVVNQGLGTRIINLRTVQRGGGRVQRRPRGQEVFLPNRRNMTRALGHAFDPLHGMTAAEAAALVVFVRDVETCDACGHVFRPRELRAHIVAVHGAPAH